MCLHCTDRFRGAQHYVQWYWVSHPVVERPRWSVDHRPPPPNHAFSSPLLGWTSRFCTRNCQVREFSSVIYVVQTPHCKTKGSEYIVKIVYSCAIFFQTCFQLVMPSCLGLYFAFHEENFFVFTKKTWIYRSYESNGRTWSTEVTFQYLRLGCRHTRQPKQRWRGQAQLGFWRDRS